MKSAEQSRVASRMAENEIKKVTFEIEKDSENEKNHDNEEQAGVLAEQALLNGLQSAENSRAESRMLAEQICQPRLTPEVMKLVQEALDDGMLSRFSNYSETDQPRMTPVVLKLVEDAMRGGLESPLPEAPFPEQVAAAIQAFSKEDAMPAGVLFQKLQELSAILALILRDHLMELSSFEEDLHSLKTGDIKNRLESYNSGDEEILSTAKNQLTGNVKNF